MREVYLDAAASYPPSSDWGIGSWPANPHSLHMKGQYARHLIETAESVLRKKLSVQGGTFFWTGSGSEANRLAIEHFCERGGLVTSVLEHKSIGQLTRRYGTAADATPEGCINFNELLRHCNKFTSLVSIQLANNETGVINIDPQVARDKKAPQALLHSDLSQAFCKLDLAGTCFDLITLSAHKIGGPKGLGCLWVRQVTEGVVPYLGTPNPMAIHAFKCAVDSFPDYEEYRKKMVSLENTLLSGLDTIRYEINGTESRVPGIINLAFCNPYIDATELTMILTSKGIHLSTGAACNNKLGQRSHVLQAMGLSDERIDSSIRISFHHHLTEDDVRYAAQVISETVKEISSGS